MGKDKDSKAGADVEPEVDYTETGETLDTTEAGTNAGGEAPHHQQNDAAQK